MSVRSKGGVPANLFTADVKAQIHAAMDQLLDQHHDAIHEAIAQSEDKKLPVNFVVDIDSSESTPQIEVKMRFTSGTVTDKRTIKYADENQAEMKIFLPSEIEAQAAALKAKRAADKAAANAAEGGDEPDPETEPEGDGQKKGKGKGKKAKDQAHE